MAGGDTRSDVLTQFADIIPPTRPGHSILGFSFPHQTLHFPYVVYAEHFRHTAKYGQRIRAHIESNQEHKIRVPGPGGPIYTFCYVQIYVLTVYAEGSKVPHNWIAPDRSPPDEDFKPNHKPSFVASGWQFLELPRDGRAPPLNANHGMVN